MVDNNGDLPVVSVVEMFGVLEVKVDNVVSVVGSIVLSRVEGKVLVGVSIVLPVVTLVLDTTKVVTKGPVMDEGVIDVAEVVVVTIAVVDFLVAVDMVILGEVDVSISNIFPIPVIPILDIVEEV